MRAPFRLTVHAFRAGELQTLSRNMPTTVEQCLEHPPMVVLKNPVLVGERPLLQYIEAEIIRVNAQLNVAHPMNSQQVVFSAQTLLQEYGTETLADISLCLKRGAAGYYGSSYHQLDCSVIVGWLKQYLEEKATLRERFNVERKREEAQDKIDYRAVAERINKQREEAREKAINAMVERVEGQEAKQTFRRDYKPMEPQQVQLLNAIREICSKRYRPLRGGEFKEFFNYDVEGVRIFSRSEEEAKEIYQEALVVISLTKTPQP